jgi:hypothetical protein
MIMTSCMWQILHASLLVVLVDDKTYLRLYSCMIVTTWFWQILLVAVLLHDHDFLYVINLTCSCTPGLSRSLHITNLPVAIFLHDHDFLHMTSACGCTWEWSWLTYDNFYLRLYSNMIMIADHKSCLLLRSSMIMTFCMWQLLRLYFSMIMPSCMWQIFISGCTPAWSWHRECDKSYLWL